MGVARLEKWLRDRHTYHAGQRSHVGVHQRLHHLQAGAHGQRQQALLHALGDLGHREHVSAASAQVNDVIVASVVGKGDDIHSLTMLLACCWRPRRAVTLAVLSPALTSRAAKSRISSSSIGSA